MGFYFYMLDGTLIKDYRNSATDYQKVEFLPNRLAHLNSIHNPFKQQFVVVIMYQEPSTLYTVDMPFVLKKRKIVENNLPSSDIDFFTGLSFVSPDSSAHRDVFFNVSLAELLGIAKSVLADRYKIDFNQTQPEILDPRIPLFCSTEEEVSAAHENDMQDLNANLTMGFPEDGESSPLAGLY